MPSNILRSPHLIPCNPHSNPVITLIVQKRKFGVQRSCVTLSVSDEVRQLKIIG